MKQILAIIAVAVILIAGLATLVALWDSWSTPDAPTPAETHESPAPPSADNEIAEVTRSQVTAGTRTEAEGSIADADPMLVPGFRLAVTVRDASGRAVSGCDVGLSDRLDQEYWPGGDGELVTNSAGVVRFAGVQVDRVAVRALADGYTEARRVTSLEPDTENQLDIILQPGGRMIGNIVDGETGRPPGFRDGSSGVYRSVLNGQHGVVGIGMNLDASGSFAERGLEPGPYEVTVNVAGYRTMVLGPRVLEPGGVLDWGTIELQRGVQIDVRVVDSDGRAIQGAQVSAFYGSQSEVTTDGGGSAVVAVPSIDPVTLQARHQGYARGYVDNVQPEEAPNRSKVTITLTRGGVVRGRFQDDEGAPLPSTRIQLSPIDRKSSLTAMTDESGNYRFEHVTPGTYVLEYADPPISRQLSGPFAVADGQVVELDATRDPVTVLDGAVVDAGGTPVAGCQVTAGHRPSAAPDGGWAIRFPSGRAHTDASGRFQFSGTAASSRALEVSSPAGQRVVFLLQGRPQPLVLVLPDETANDCTATVAGVVLDATTREPLAGALVALEWVAPEVEVAIQRRFQQPCDLEGAFRLAVPPGELRVVVTHADRAGETQSVAARSGQTARVEIALHPAGRLTFVARSTLPKSPLEQWEVTARIPGDPQATRNARGRFGRALTLEGLRRGMWYEVTIQALGHAVHRESLLVGIGDGPPIEVELAADADVPDQE